jgi:hypothetical protein
MPISEDLPFFELYTSSEDVILKMKEGKKGEKFALSGFSPVRIVTGTVP